MARKTDRVELPTACLRDLVRWVKSQDVPAAIVGGVAASLLGRPRTTRDVDVLVMLDEQRWSAFAASGRAFGFEPRGADAVEFAHEARVLLMRHTPSPIDVDLILGMLDFERELLENVVTVPVGRLRVPVPRPEDLIIQKAVARRARDLADIEGILDAHPRLDLARVRRLAAEISAALEMPEILTELEALVSRRKPRRPKKKR